MADTRDINTILKNYKFDVVFYLPGGIEIKGGFSSISGLGDETEVIEYREGVDAPHMKKFNGLSSTGDVTFARGVTTGGKGLSEWRERVKEGKIPIKELKGTIGIWLIPESVDSAPSAEYILSDAWPSALEISDLDAGSSEAIIETMTIVAEKIERDL